MIPVIFKIGFFEIRSYGLMLAIAFLVGIYIFVKEGSKEKIEKEKIFDLSFYVIVVSLIFSRLTFILMNLGEYVKEPFSILWPVSGLSFHGGLVGGILAGILFARKNKISFLKLADAASPSLAIGMSIARVGCFLNGCCIGYQSNVPWAVKFKNMEYFSHPSQIYDAILNLFLFIFLVFIRKYKKKDGYIFSLYLMGSAITRFLVEFTRKGASANVFVFGLTEAQVFCIVLFLVSVLILKK